jgi:hypothetical protein
MENYTQKYKYKILSEQQQQGMDWGREAMT